MVHFALKLFSVWVIIASGILLFLIPFIVHAVYRHIRYGEDI